MAGIGKKASNCSYEFACFLFTVSARTRTYETGAFNLDFMASGSAYSAHSLIVASWDENFG